jgi:thiamine biosynthesis protein ThiS|uniref:Thiamine biosynthesis protein ThiS n=1 Tax=Cyanidiaceae sp. MX-AZ01 TaxID=1503164 RepID=A0A060A4X8_9RHOD|nr:hypothetical protein [Cyanidiaceae sp. MX-AZ01]UNJ15345.1 thiamine biosynthesis protein S [Cyanidioschyzonaceae sp. 1]
MMTIYLNGNKFVIKDAMSVQELLEYLQIPMHMVMVEHNAQMLPKSQWKLVKLQALDRMEIITFVPGG